MSGIVAQNTLDNSGLIKSPKLFIISTVSLFVLFDFFHCQLFRRFHYFYFSLFIDLYYFDGILFGWVEDVCLDSICQIVSVINGANGCKSFRVVIST